MPKNESRENLLRRIEKEQNLYMLLGVSPDAQKTNIKRAYRDLLLEVHPDKNPGANNKIASTAFQNLSQAYEILIDDEKRALYDKLLAKNMPNKSIPQGSSAAAAEDEDTFINYRITENIASALYTRLTVEGKNKHIDGLTNTNEPNKIKKTLELLGLPFREITLNHNKGYNIVASPEVISQIIDIADNPQPKKASMPDPQSQAEIKVSLQKMKFKPFVLVDKMGDNFVDSVTRNEENNGWLIIGRNNCHETRSITIYDDGEVSGFNCKKSPIEKVFGKIGTVGQEMYLSHAQIFEHFNVDLPNKNTIPKP